MRHLMIDFNTSLIEAGYLGEHNATELVIVKPVDVIGAMYSVAFMTNGEVIHSKFFNADEDIRVPLWQQLTQDYDLGVQLEAYDEKGDYLGKSAMITLLFGNSAHGTDVIADAENPDVYSEIALNTWFRETLEDNVDTLDKLTTSENGKLLFDGKLIEGADGGGGISAELTEQIETNTENRHWHDNKNILDLLGINNALTRPTFNGGRNVLATQEDITDKLTYYATKSSVPNFASVDGSTLKMQRKEENKTTDLFSVVLPASGSGGGSGASGQLDIDVKTDTEYEYVLTLSTPDETITTPNLKGKEGKQGVSGVYVGSGDMPDGYNVQIDPTGDITAIPETIFIPDYWNDYLEEKISDIKANQEKGGKDCFSFVVITDMHYEQNLGKQSPLLAKKIMDECNIKYALIFGDLTTRAAVASEAEMENSFIGAKTMLQPILGRALLTQGNHDGAWGQYDANGDGEISETDYYCFNYSPAKMYERIYRSVSCVDGVHFDKSGTGYYIDDTANKVRYIILNTHCVKHETNSDGTAVNNTMRTFRCTQSQFDMTIEALDSIPSEDWNIIVGSHFPVIDGFDYNGDGNNDYFLLGSDIPLIRELLTAFNCRETYAKSFGTENTWEYVNVDVDFTGAKGRVLGCFAGHIHVDMNLSETVSGVPVITTRCDSQTENLDDLCAERVKGTITEQSFDVVTIDKVNCIAYITKIGAGNSREFSLLSAYKNQIPLSIEADGTEYVGTNGEDGYKTDTRLSSSTGEEKTEQGMSCTGFIPCLSGQTIRIANVTMIGSTGVSYIVIYDGNKNFINAVSTNDMTENNEVYSYSPSQGSMAFIRLSIGEITEESIVTIDEEIGA